MYYNDLAQNGWVDCVHGSEYSFCLPALQCPGDPGCLPGASAGGAGAIIDPNYHTPYTLT